MQELSEHPPAVTTWLGSRYDFQRIPVQVSYGNAFIRAARLTDWDYEVAEYTEGAESFGIRCRPKDADEGWLYFSFWPEGYAPAEADLYCLESLSDSYRQVTGWPSDVLTKNGVNTVGRVFTFAKTQYPTGDYAIINDGAEEWWTELSNPGDILLLTTFTYGTEARSGGIQYGNVTVNFSSAGLEDAALLYFDWDKITGALNTDTLTLVDAQYSGNDLFVTGQYGDNFCLLCFEKGEKSGYAFKGIQPYTSVSAQTFG